MIAFGLYTHDEILHRKERAILVEAKYIYTHAEIEPRCLVKVADQPLVNSQALRSRSDKDPHLLHADVVVWEVLPLC